MTLTQPVTLAEITIWYSKNAIENGEPPWIVSIAPKGQRECDLPNCATPGAALDAVLRWAEQRGLALSPLPGESARAWWGTGGILQLNGKLG